MKTKLISILLVGFAAGCSDADESAAERNAWISADPVIEMAIQPNLEEAHAHLNSTPDALRQNPWLTIFAYKAVAKPNAAQTQAFEHAVGEYFEAQQELLIKALAAADLQRVETALQRAVNASIFDSSSAILEQRVMSFLRTNAADTPMSIKLDQAYYGTDEYARALAAQVGMTYFAKKELGLLNACSTQALSVWPARQPLCWRSGEQLLRHAQSITDGLIAVGQLKQSAKSAAEKVLFAQRSQAFQPYLDKLQADQAPGLATLQSGEIQAYLRSYEQLSGMTLPADQLQALDTMGQRILAASTPRN
jgi:hypothetical protein